MHKLRQKSLIRYLKRGGKIWTSPPGGTQGSASRSCQYKVCVQTHLYFTTFIIIHHLFKILYVLSNFRLQNLFLVNQTRCLSTTNVSTNIGKDTNKESASEWHCTEDSCINLPKEADVVIIGLQFFQFKYLKEL